MKDFILPPYEYVGASFNPRAHAETRLELGGKKRNFVLKLRDSVIYFKEPSRAPIFAIPLLFAPELASDTIGLVSAWQREVTAGNYGAYIVKRDYFQGLPVRGQFLMLMKSDGCGWMKEWFDAEWFDLPIARQERVYELWNPGILEAQTKDLLLAVKASLLQRTLEPETRQGEATHWVGGSEMEFSALVRAASQVLLAPAHFVDYTVKDFELRLVSHSAFAKGEIEGYWLQEARCHHDFRAVWDLIEAHFHFVGVAWHEGGEQNSDLWVRQRSEKIFEAGIERWGENWRGNWAPRRGKWMLQVPFPGEYSAHEKMEAMLLLRDWLRGKMPDAQINALQNV